MVRLAGEYGVSLATCLAGSGITPEEIADAAAEIRGQRELEVLRNILRALGPEDPSH